MKSTINSVSRRQVWPAVHGVKTGVVLKLNGLTETSVYCPYCGETISVIIETLEEEQEYIEDCQVCCRPIIFRVAMSGSAPEVSVRTENDTY